MADLAFADVVARLNAERFDRDMTWAQFTEFAAYLGISLATRTLHHTLTADNPRPLARTVHKLRKFLERLDALDAADAPTLAPDTTHAA